VSGFADFEDTGAGSVQSTDVYLLINTESHTAEQDRLRISTGVTEINGTGYKTPKHSSQ